uniref:Uncharacterized protein n=1 Tax=Ditylenchus dipsaci TaxID=166011 RepID=A0A915CKR5_9BILA
MIDFACYYVIEHHGWRLRCTSFKRLKLDNVSKENTRKLIVILEDCSLETAKVGQDHVILCSDKHANFLRKNKKDPAQYRPDILHQCLLMLMDCPLNQAVSYKCILGQRERAYRDQPTMSNSSYFRQILWTHGATSPQTLHSRY